MARIRSTAASSGHTLMVVDDDPDLRRTLSQILRQDGHLVLEAEDGPHAVAACREQPVHLMLLDYVMPGMNGAEVVEQVRTFDPAVQIVLQTGYASEQPARQMLAELDIQGYHDKSEGPARLLVWVDAALKTYRHVRALSTSRQGLEYILQATPELHRLQPLEHLLKGIVLSIQGLLGFSSACLATVGNPLQDVAAGDVSLTGDALLALREAQQFKMRVGTGRFSNCDWDALDLSDQQLLIKAALSGEVSLGEHSVLPLKVGPSVVGVVLFDVPSRVPADLHLLEIFASQAAVAIENVRLYSLATVDDLTGLSVKRSWMQRVVEALGAASRQGTETSVLVIDIDHFKRVNDTYGHLAGDWVLAALGRLLLAEVRVSDVAGRYGGEEMVVLLPNTGAAGARLLAERLLLAVRELHVPWYEQSLSVTVSIGAATVRGGGEVDLSVSEPALDPSEEALTPASRLVQVADQALYLAKHGGRDRVVAAGDAPPTGTVGPDPERR